MKRFARYIIYLVVLIVATLLAWARHDINEELAMLDRYAAEIKGAGRGHT